MSIKRILVTGAGGSPGVNFIQSLRESPERFYVVAADANMHHLQWPDADRKVLVPPCSHPEYIEILNEIIDEDGIEMVHAQPDVEVRRISAAREQLHARTWFPEHRVIDILQDKFETGKRWAAAGIRNRPTLSINTRSDLANAATQLGFPFWMRASSGAGARGSTLVTNQAVGYHWLSYWRARGESWNFIAEEYLPGRDLAWTSLWENGRLITSQGRERLEYIYPHLAPSGRTGTPIVARTVNDEAVNEISTRCVLAIDPNATGIFSVDLREDASGNPIPTEINCGRFFTTSLFFSRAGLNVPYMYVKRAFGESIPLTPQFNALPEGLHWIRHIDCPTVLISEEELTCDSRCPMPLVSIAA
jgi:carbamoyl-phosphate synthase large subunit